MERLTAFGIHKATIRRAMETVRFRAIRLSSTPGEIGIMITEMITMTKKASRISLDPVRRFKNFSPVKYRNRAPPFFAILFEDFRDFRSFHLQDPLENLRYRLVGLLRDIFTDLAFLIQALRQLDVAHNGNV